MGRLALSVDKPWTMNAAICSKRRGPPSWSGDIERLGRVDFQARILSLLLKPWTVIVGVRQRPVLSRLDFVGRFHMPSRAIRFYSAHYSHGVSVSFEEDYVLKLSLRRDARR